MRHVRDPVTGLCVVCKTGHTVNHPGNGGPPPVHSNPPKPKSGWDDVRKKVIYVNAANAFANPSYAAEPPPPASPEVVYVKSRPPTPIFVERDPTPPPSGRKSPRPANLPTPPPSPPASPSKVRLNTNKEPDYFIGGPPGYIGNFQPPPYEEDYRSRPRGRSPERGRPRSRPSSADRDRDRSLTPEPGCCGSGRHSRKYDEGRGYLRGRELHRQGYYDRYGRAYDGRVDPQVGGKPYHPTYSANWAWRRCCTVFCAAILLLSLAGLAVGTYYGVMELQRQEALEKSLPIYNQAGGYYLDGVYVVPVTDRIPDTYLVYGLDQPCNSFNNNTNAADFPINCVDVTTRLVLDNAFLDPNLVVPTTVPDILGAGTAVDGGGNHVIFDIATMLISLLMIMGIMQL